MMLMPSTHSSALFHYLSGRYPGRLGWLFDPLCHQKTALHPWVPFALDNGAYGAFKRGIAWDGEAWMALLRRVAEAKRTPRWVLIPDVVGNREATLANWPIYVPLVESIGWPTAFALQDGMGILDVPPDASVVFLGGSAEWKWATVEMWAANFKRLHVGRVNSVEKLRYCESLGVESCDGTGWFRDASRKDRDIEAWLSAKPPTTNPSIP